MRKGQGEEERGATHKQQQRGRPNETQNARKRKRELAGSRCAIVLCALFDRCSGCLLLRSPWTFASEMNSTDLVVMVDVVYESSLHMKLRGYKMKPNQHEGIKCSVVILLICWGKRLGGAARVDW